jgi:hypothetical protein
MKRVVISLAILVVGALAPALAFAHHGASAYDHTKVVEYKATVTDFQFINPHVQIYFDTKDDQGNVTHWSCESVNPGMLERIGWTRHILKPGDQVAIFANPNKTGATVVLLQKVVLANGQVLESKLLN